MFTALTGSHWYAGECHSANKQGTHQLQSYGQPAGRAYKQHPSRTVYVLISVKVLYEKFLYTIGSHCLQAMDSGTHMRVHRTARWKDGCRNTK